MEAWVGRRLLLEPTTMPPTSTELLPCFISSAHFCKHNTG